MQDWEDVVLRKGAGRGRGTAAKQEAIKQADRAGAHLVAEQKKHMAGTNKSHAGPSNAYKLDEDTGDYHVDRVSLDFGRALQQARVAKKWTQADLAAKVSEKANVINQYEAGKAVPDQAVITKLSKVLGVKLPRPVPKPSRPSEE